MIACVSFIFFVIITSTYCKDCMKLDLSLVQKVDYEGYHRRIRWLLESVSPNLSEWIASECRLSLYINVNPGLFVNGGEIADYMHHRDYSIRIIGDVNIESPAHASISHVAIIYLPKEKIERVVFDLPIHLRYQRAQITGKFAKVYFERPSLLVTCPHHIALCGKRRPIIDIPCHYSTDERCSWRNATYRALFEDVEMAVPIGDLDDYPFVSIVSLLFGCAGCIYVLSIFSTTPI